MVDVRKKWGDEILNERRIRQRDKIFTGEKKKIKREL